MERELLAAGEKLLVRAHLRIAQPTDATKTAAILAQLRPAPRLSAEHCGCGPRCCWSVVAATEITALIIADQRLFQCQHAFAVQS